MDQIERLINAIESIEALNLLSGPNYISVDTVSKTLVTLGITLNDNVKKVTLVPDGSGIFWKDGTVTVNDAPLPVGGVEITCRKNSIATREFIVASGTVKMQVVQEG